MDHHIQSPLIFANLADKPVQADFDAGFLSSETLTPKGEASSARSAPQTTAYSETTFFVTFR